MLTFPVSDSDVGQRRDRFSSWFAIGSRRTDMQRHTVRTVRGSLLLLALAATILSASKSFAIPAFSRMYGTSCSTCHIDFPKLNDFGKAFKDAGFKFPKDDEAMIKIPPVMLGAPANSELWPKAI